MDFADNLTKDIIIILQLILIEGILSLDNALALAALVKSKIPSEKQQKLALLYGLWGAYIFRTLMIIFGVWFIQNPWVKFVAGAYLVFICIKELFFQSTSISSPGSIPKKTIFWIVILQVELMDIMFSIDSIAVALALSEKVWVLVTGALLGILMMRVAAGAFIKLIDIFPLIQKAAFVIVGFAGLNVILRIKELRIDDWFYWKIDKAMPEGVFLWSITLIFLGSMVLNKIFPHITKKKHTSINNTKK